jgi:integrase
MLRKRLAEYVALRRATGFTFLDSETQLRSFVAFALKRGDRYVGAETAVAWSAKANGQMQRHKRLRVVTRFAEYLRAEDPRHEIPPQHVFHPHAHRPSPHIFTDEDIRYIVAGAARLGSPGSFQGKMYSTLFGLIATTGLRFSEAACLRFSDITPDGLIIRQTKFRKSRLVPLHPTTSTALNRYLADRRRVAADDFVFITQRRTRPSHGVSLRTFRAVCGRAGVGRSPSGAPPRIHDLRHTFAVRALERSPVGRDRVERHIVALTTYLGHARIESTYWYLERTPRLLKDIAAACEAIVAGAQP